MTVNEDTNGQFIECTNIFHKHVSGTRANHAHTHNHLNICYWQNNDFSNNCTHAWLLHTSYSSTKLTYMQICMCMQANQQLMRVPQLQTLKSPTSNPLTYYYVITFRGWLGVKKQWSLSVLVSLSLSLIIPSWVTNIQKPFAIICNKSERVCAKPLILSSSR